MRIEFDPTNPTEAAAVRAMLTALGPTPDLTSLNEPIADYISHVSKTARENMVAVSQAQIDTLRVVPSTADTDPWHQGTTVQREAIPTGVTDDGWQTVEAGQVTDSTGTPWDERIHSTPATTNKDGTWRAKRGVTADQIAAVRAEREATPPVALAEETVEEHIAEVAAAFEEPVTVPPAPPVTTAPPAPIVAPEPPTPGETLTVTGAGTAVASPSFLDVMKAITAAQKDGKIDTAKVKELCAAVGAGESTMGLNGPDNGDKRVAFMALLAEETK
jgi:hypothetical protein